MGDEVLTHRGRFRQVLAVHEQGELPLLKITTGFGRTVRSAYDHPFLTPRGWVQAQHLTADDCCGVPFVCDEREAQRILPHAWSLLNRGFESLTCRFGAADAPLWRDKVIAVEPAGTGECFCLTVEEDHSFTVNGLAVRNSLMSNVFFPAWQWGPMDRADLRYLSFCYAAHLTRRDNRKLINLVKSQSFIELWGKERGFELVKEGEELVANSRTGWKFATSVGGVSTGERGNVLLADDLHNVKDTESDLIRTGTVRWFRESMSNRLNNFNDAIIVIGQRVHCDDVCGNIIEDPEGLGYTQLRIPMEYIPYDACAHPTSIGWVDPRTYAGELAWPERYPESFLRQFKIIDHLWASQYMQDPVPRGGAIINQDWWRVWEDPEALKCRLCGSLNTQPLKMNIENSRWRKCLECNQHFIGGVEQWPICSYVLASLDTSFTSLERNDPSAFTVWGLFKHPKTNEHGIILMDAWQKWLKMNSEPVERFPDETDFQYSERCKPKWGLVEWTVHSCRRHNVDALLIENKTSGITLQQELQIQYGREKWATIMKHPEGSKEARAHSIVGTFTNGMVWAPNRPWANEAITEIAKFPFGKHNDIMDSTSQALRHLRNSGLLELEEERLADQAEETRPRERLKPLYPV